MKSNIASKLLAASLASGMLVSMAACGDGGDKAADDGSKLTISVIQRSTQQPLKEMEWPKELAKKTGVDITWKSIDEETWNNQKSGSMAGDNVADITLYGYTLSDTAKFQHLFEDLSDDIDKMPNVKKLFDEQPDAKRMVATLDGKIYNLPTYRGKNYDVTNNRIMLNKTWLDKLGLAVPKTLDDLADVLEAFATKDPNGNGKADEIGFTMRPLSTSRVIESSSPFLLLNSFGIATDSQSQASREGIYAKDGKVGTFLTIDEFRKVIDFLSELYGKGLIPEGAITQEWGEYVAQIQGDGSAAVDGMNIGWSTLDFGDYADEYDPIEVPKGDASMSDDEVTWDVGKNIWSTRTAVKKSEGAKKDAILKVLNEMYSEEFSIKQYYGDSKWWTKDGSTYTLKQPDVADAKSDGKDPGLSELAAANLSDDLTIDTADGDPFTEEGAVYTDQIANADPQKDAVPMYVVPSETDQATLSNNFINVWNYALPVISGWITDGKGVSDEQWNEYVSNVEKNGMTANVEIWQKTYDEYMK